MWFEALLIALFVILAAEELSCARYALNCGYLLTSGLHGLVSTTAIAFVVVSIVALWTHYQ